ncbi:hypothetical protein RIF29_26605 [Crotalaria pallida]|uniref:Uncharacterized protein n=1 Tax=Crotalaria pallida TaxID=3830 RepID=A0AAN9EV73_CROPI
MGLVIWKSPCKALNVVELHHILVKPHEAPSKHISNKLYLKRDISKQARKVATFSLERPRVLSRKQS